jgi:hypothetical protein
MDDPDARSLSTRHDAPFRFIGVERNSSADR